MINKFTDFCLFFVLALFCANFTFAQTAPRKLSLLTAQCKAREGACYTKEIVRYDFTDGEFVSKEIVAIVPEEETMFDLAPSRIIENRYVIGSAGGFFDLQTRQFLGDFRGHPIDVVGFEVIVEEANRIGREGVYVFNLQSGKYRKLGSPNVFESKNDILGRSPGKFSPDKTRFAFFKYNGSKRELRVSDIKENFKSGKTISIKGPFNAWCSLRCSGGMSVPFVWVDNENILTQTGNGELVKVNINGTVEPVVKIKIDESPDSLPRLFRNDAGDIKYYIGGTSYSIDVKNKTFTKHKTIIGNDFEKIDGDVFWAEYFYNGNSIGRVWSNDPVTYKGFLAVQYAKEGQNLGSVDGIKIWNDIKKDWITIPVDWGAELIGWISE